MTTTVTISPAGHTVEVITIDQVSGQEPVTSSVTLQPGSAAHSTYITDTRSLAIREIPAAPVDQQAAAPVSGEDDAEHEGQEARVADDEDEDED